MSRNNCYFKIVWLTLKDQRDGSRAAVISFVKGEKEELEEEEQRSGG